MLDLKDFYSFLTVGKLKTRSSTMLT